MAKLGDVCSLITDGSHFSPKDIGTGYPMLSVKDMKEKDFSFDGCKHISEEDYQTLLRNGCQPKKGDVLLAKDGSYFKYAFIVEEERELAVLSSIAILRPKVDIIDPRYLREFLMADSTYKTVSLNYISGTALKRVILQGIKKINVPLPAIEDQRKIAEKFIKLDQLIALRKEQLAKLDQLVKSRFIELFGDIASCPKYDGVTLGTICTTLSGGTPTTKVPEYYTGDIPWISTPYLGNNHINGSSAKAYITEEAIKNSATHLIPANTIMFGIRVGVGKSSIIDEPMCANQDIVALMGIDTSKYNLLFVKHVLDAYQSHFDSIKKGATILGITTEDLKNVLVPTVDVEIQNQFAAFVEQIDKSKLAIQQSLDKLELLKKSLMQEYFG